MLSKRIGALAAAMAGAWDGLVTADRTRLHRGLVVGRAAARDLGAPETMAWPSCRRCGGGRHLSARYLVIAGAALALVVLVLVIVLGVGAHPDIAARAGRRVAGLARHVRSGIDPDEVAQTSTRLALLARSALTGRAFVASFGFASADLLFDLLSLDLMFAAVRYQPGFGPLAVGYCAANFASALPITPGGLGVAEVTMVAITVGFGAPRPTAVLAVLGYRIVNYWLPLVPGAAAYIRLRLSPNEPTRQGLRCRAARPAKPDPGASVVASSASACSAPGSSATGSGAGARKTPRSGDG